MSGVGRFESARDFYQRTSPNRQIGGGGGNLGKRPICDQKVKEFVFLLATSQIKIPYLLIKIFMNEINLLRKNGMQSEIPFSSSLKIKISH